MVDKEILYEGKFLRVVRVGKWEYVERTTGKNVTYIIPVFRSTETKERFLLFIKEWRVPLQKYVVGFPAGLVGDIDSNEEVVTSAKRELIEETGYSAGRMRLMTSGPSSAGLSDETAHFYLADRLTMVSAGGGDETENISVHAVALDNAMDWLDKQAEADDTVIGAKVYAGLYWAEYMNDTE